MTQGTEGRHHPRDSGGTTDAIPRQMTRFPQHLPERRVQGKKEGWGKGPSDTGNTSALGPVGPLCILIQAASLFGDTRQLHTSWTASIRTSCLVLGVRLVLSFLSEEPLSLR